MQTISIRVDDIEIGERHRALSEDAVQRLATSMREIGLKQPISVRVVDEMEIEGELTSGVPLLVAGAHRLAAAKTLAWSHIDCIEVEDDPISAELWEIAENLHRCDLTKDQRDKHIRRYAELIALRRSDEKPGTDVRVSNGRGNKSIATEVAENTGLTARHVRRVLSEQPRTVPVPPPPLDPEDAYNKWAKTGNEWWSRGSQEWRERWDAERDAPIMDSRYAA